MTFFPTDMPAVVYSNCNNNIDIKNELEEALVLVKVKHQVEVLKDKNQDQVLLLKVSKVVRCHFIEDYQKEVLIQSIR